MLCWLYGAPDWASDAVCFELLNTRDWDCGPSSEAGSASEEEGGVFPSNTARSILNIKHAYIN